MKIVIDSTASGKRIDHILSAHIKDISRSQIQNTFFAGRRVSVNGKIVAKNYLVKEGDAVVVDETAQKPAPFLSVRKPRILFENQDYIVLDKPSGLLVHPTNTVSGPTLVDFLMQHAPSIGKVGDDPSRPGIVHRLDKDASGVMVAAKTFEMFDVLKTQFKLRKVKKQYLLLVYGVPSKPTGEITFALSRAKHSPRIAACAKHGRAAWTHYSVEQDFGRYALIRAEPHTGRTHQIRVHFFAFGHPIVGDTVYVPSHVKNKIQDVRLMLHAILLGFYDLKGVYREYRCDPDNDFIDVLARISKVAQ